MVDFPTVRQKFPVDNLEDATASDLSMAIGFQNLSATFFRFEQLCSGILKSYWSHPKLFFSKFIKTVFWYLVLPWQLTKIEKLLGPSNYFHNSSTATYKV